jgi:hypothetical protein
MDSMIKRILVISAIPAIFVVLLAGCGNRLKEFTFSYSMESVNHYKATVSFDSNKTYKIEVHNYYMDNHAGKQAPVVKEGTLTEEEYKTLETLLAKCNFFKMNDSYGFDRDADEYIGDIMYQVYFQTPRKDKFISIRNISDHTFPLPFVDLLGYINTFLAEHK